MWITETWVQMENGSTQDSLGTLSFLMSPWCMHSSLKDQVDEELGAQGILLAHDMDVTYNIPASK